MPIAFLVPVFFGDLFHATFVFCNLYSQQLEVLFLQQLRAQCRGVVFLGPEMERLLGPGNQMPSSQNKGKLEPLLRFFQVCKQNSCHPHLGNQSMSKHHPTLTLLVLDQHFDNRHSRHNCMVQIHQVLHRVLCCG